MTDKLQQAIAQIRAGDKIGGKRLLGEVLRDDPNNETAWLWMSGVVETDQQRADCLERILKINPNNRQARLGLEKLAEKMRQEQQALGDWSEAFGGISQAEQPTEKPLDFFSASVEEKPPLYAAPFDEASLADFFRSGGTDFESAEEPFALTEDPFRFLGEQRVEEFKFDEPAEGSFGGTDFLSRALSDAAEYEPEPLPDVLSETPGFFDEEAGDQQPTTAAFTSPAFTTEASGAFLEDESVGVFLEQPVELDEAALAQPSVYQPPRIPGLDFEPGPPSVTAPGSAFAQSPASAEQRVWADPKARNNRLTVVSADGLVVINPGKDRLEQVREQIERGDMPDETLMREARIIRMENILRVQARSGDVLLKVEHRTDQSVRTDTFEYSTAQICSEILNTLHRSSGGRLKRRMERASLLSTAGAPAAFLVLVIIATAICFLGVYSITTRALSGPISPAQIQIMQFLLNYGQLVVIFLGGLLGLAAVAWLAFSLLRPPKDIVLRAKESSSP